MTVKTKAKAAPKAAIKPKRTIHDMLRNPDNKIFLYELLKGVAGAEELAEKQDIMRKYASKGPEYTKLLRYFAECMYHPEVSFDLPEGKPDFREYADATDPTLAPATLFNEIKKVRYFCHGSSAKIVNPKKRQDVFVQVLESMYKEESKLLVMMKDKKLDRRVYPTITEELFRATFPEWLPEAEPKNV